ncbi:MAG: hypothetical protein U0Y10_23500 [Spirosomataceae bacterium]
MPILTFISISSIFLPALMGVWRFQYLRHAYVWLCVYLWITAFVEGLGAINIFYSSHSNHQQELFPPPVIYNIQTIAEFACLSRFYYQFLESVNVRKLLIVMSVVFLPFALYHYVSAPSHWNSQVMGLESFFLIWIAMLYLYQLMRNILQTSLSRHPMFLITVGMLLYFAGVFFVYLSIEYILSPEHFKEVNWLWDINHYVNIPFHLLVALGMWYVGPESK